MVMGPLPNLLILQELRRIQQGERSLIARRSSIERAPVMRSALFAKFIARHQLLNAEGSKEIFGVL
jgi:hypothetical protein